VIVAQWDSTKEADKMSGLRRYTDELFKRTSKEMNINRIPYHGFNLESYHKYCPGDVTHITTQNFAFLGYAKHVKNCIVTVNDLIPEHWYNRFQKIRHKWVLTEYSLDKAADRYIAISKYTKQDLLTCFPKIQDDQVTVVYDGVDSSVYYPRDRAAARKKFGFINGKEYLLVVSSGLPWKNLKLLEGLKNAPYEVINVGYGRGKLGYIKDEDMPDLYSACDVFLAPSKAEGFGLPLLEAMACGCPVIASDATSHPEIVGRYTGGILDNPDNLCDWVISIESILQRREKWSDRALEQSKKFTWDKCAAETMAIYKEFK
jgi:glycosyltransferase involved in cell wall biosynthesis